MPGRRYSEGLHQALEAKEHQPIQPENQTLASIPFQNYFRMYEKLAGMTGTALTEADEFLDIYNLDVLEVPTNMPLVRIDDDDEVYRTAKEKYRSIITLIEDCKLRGQPVLVGTTSIEKSEQLAQMLREAGWEAHDFTDPNAFAALYSGDDGATKTKVFAILNARYHEQEAFIVSQAGVPGAITIATNMAGRGTDIQLGGNADMRIRQEITEIENPREREKSPRADEIRAQIARLKQKALAAGGLYVLGTERHESRRLDNQLRGRSGPQGDPGASRFYLSLEDDLMRMVNSERVRADPGRAAELRDPQGRAQVRRRAQPAAQGHLRRAPHGARGRRPARADPRDGRRGGRRVRRGRDRRRLSGRVGPGQAVARLPAALPGQHHRRRGHRRCGRRASRADRGVHQRGDHRRRAGRVRTAGAGVRFGGHAGGRAPGGALRPGPQVARAPVRDGLPA